MATTRVFFSRGVIFLALISLVVTGSFTSLWSGAFSRPRSDIQVLGDDGRTPQSFNSEFKLDNFLFPVLDLPQTPWIAHNQRTIRELIQCSSSVPVSCAQNQTKVVILASYRFRSVLEGHMNGEEIWARSTALALKNMGYSYLYATTKRSFGELYRMFPQLVKIIIVDEDVSRDCFVDEQCIMSEENPYGVPAWKIFSFVFWLQPGNPLGHSWTLNPEDYQLEFSWNVPNTYLGYSVEPGCRSTPFIPHYRRPQPPQAWVLSKHLRYFEPGGHAWQADFYDDAAKATGAQFVIGADGDSTPPEFPESLKNVGVMPQAKFYQTLANSAVLIGVGGPVKSPTPYDALCLGVPFINPILEWDANDPTNRDQWNAQHGMLKDFDPPYVYHVFQGDKEGFLRAIKDALANPIESYILDRMRMSAVEQRLAGIIERDWETEARILLDKRKASGSEPLFTVRVAGT